MVTECYKLQTPTTLFAPCLDVEVELGANVQNQPGEAKAVATARFTLRRPRCS